MTQVKEKTFTLPNEKIRVEFIKRQKGSIINEKHVLYGGMSETARRHLVPRRSKSTFNYIQLLSKEEQKHLEDLLSLKEGDLNVYKENNNRWDKINVDLKKEGITLNLSDPIDYMRYKMILSYDDLVAESLADRKLKNKRTYEFVVVRKGEKSNITVNIYNIKKEAYAIAAKLEVNMDKVKEFLYLAGKRAAGDASVAKIKSMLAELVDKDPQKVIDIITASDYTVRSLLSRAVLAGVVKDAGGRYFLEDGVALSAEGEIPTLSNAISFLASNKNADIKNLIEAKLGK